MIDQVPPLHAAGGHDPSLTTHSKLTRRASPDAIHDFISGATEYLAGKRCTMNASPAETIVSGFFPPNTANAQKHATAQDESIVTDFIFFISLLPLHGS
jgi:hypothetical protein